MSKSWTNDGIKQILNTFFKGTAASEELEIVLFTNNVTPIQSSTNGDFITLSTGTSSYGLIPKDITKTSWSTTLISGSTAYLQYNIGTGFVYSITGTISIYGYLIRGKTSNLIYFADNVGLKEFIIGDTYTINPLKLGWLFNNE